MDVTFSTWCSVTGWQWLPSPVDHVRVLGGRRGLAKLSAERAKQRGFPRPQSPRSGIMILTFHHHAFLSRARDHELKRPEGRPWISESQNGPIFGYGFPTPSGSGPLVATIQGRDLVSVRFSEAFNTETLWHYSAADSFGNCSDILRALKEATSLSWSTNAVYTDPWVVGGDVLANADFHLLGGCF